MSTANENDMNGTPEEQPPKEMSRRDAVQLLAGLPVAALLTWPSAEHEKARRFVANALRAASEGVAYAPKFFTAAEYRTVGILADMSDIRANSATVDNVRLWERDLLMQTLKQLQEIRTYYDFVSVDDDRYTIDGKYRQVHLAARELNPQSLPTRTFINERLTFTHGMGVTME